MCGIFGYVGSKDAVKVTLTGLRKLEYRGYDSAGIAGVKDGHIAYCKEVGKISALEHKASETQLKLDAAIAQTRWATHGKPTRINAHPHFDNNHTLAIVHNGIIENHSALRKQLEKKGSIFISDTDTEVIAHLISDLYEGDILKAVQQALPLLKGTYAICVVHKDHPNKIVCAAHDMPLALGIGKGENFIASDTNAFGSAVHEVLYMGEGEVALVEKDTYSLYDSSSAPISKKAKILSEHMEDITKGEYEHYTLKEIYEQPQSLKNALLSRCLDEYGTAILEDLNFEVTELLSVERILILACGTSYHAGLVASIMLEDQARIPTQVEISSEFRYKNPVIPPRTLVLAISQSGETADTLAAVREIKAKGGRILAVCNVAGSSLAREAHSCLFLRAGAEIGVCSTKAFTSQVAVLSLFSLLMARMRHMSKQQGQEILLALKKLPDQVQAVLDQGEVIRALAEKYAYYQNFFFLGRHYMFPAALEGALKLKEISYINANGYPAGEMKHGPIALINEEVPSVILMSNKITYDKLLNNIHEVKSRSGPVLALAEEGTHGVEALADDVLWLPSTIDETAVIPTSVALQLFAYHVARIRGADIDQPRNLAKSVTVE
jgi:glucosamine--fructose-6-phosphate aminotransferase (isomerizing)